MRTRTVAWLAWSLAALSVAMFLISVVLRLLARSAPVPVSWGADLTIAGLLVYVPFLAFPVVGALISFRHPRNPVGWICLADGLLWTFIGMSDNYGVYGVAKPGSVPFPVGIAGINNWLWVPAVGLLGTYLLLLFPDGRLPSRRWRPLAWLSGAVLVLASVGVMLSPGPLENLGGVRNPFGLEGQHWLSSAGYVVLPLLPLCMLASALSLVLRFRRSGGEERQQIKWIAFSASVVVIVYLIAMVASLLSPAETWFAGGSPAWLGLLQTAALLSLTAVPVAVAFAVLRYRLYEIDILINRTLVYGSLTATLALVYVGGVVVLQAMVRAISGQKSSLAVVASTLAIAALFGPLRRGVQELVDRRFYRRKYDATKTLGAFTARLREETDLNALIDEVTSVVRGTMQPKHVSLWLRPDPEKGTKSAALEQFGHEE
jgi:fumarate reductase subunit C